MLLLPSDILPIALVACLTLVSFRTDAQKKFANITASAGINHQFVVYEGMFGGGACVIDVNNDGWEDIYLTGGTVDDALYLNLGNGTFRNIFESSGLTDTRRFVTTGAATADINKDGRLDLFVTTITVRDSVKRIPRAENLVFLNNGNAGFMNVTEAFGLRDLQSFSTGVSFGDFDLDGYTDVFVGNYFLGYEGTLTHINDATIVNSNQTAEGYLLKNMSGERFENVYHKFGLNHKAFGFGGSFTDADRDGDLDLLLNNDFGYKATPNLFLSNAHPRDKFASVGKDLGLDLKINAMGTAIGDVNNDGWLDYYVTNIRFNKLMINHGAGEPFTEESKQSGMDFVSISWGANFGDFDHDTDLDLYVANGDLNPNNTPLADFYFENIDTTFRETAAAVGLNDYGIGRGSVTFDFDNDGDLDVLVVNQKSVLDYPTETVTSLYRNDSTTGNWFKVKLVGVESDKNGIGAMIEVNAGGTRMIREIDGGSSHLSQNSLTAHFGLGTATTIDEVIVHWPGGKKQVLKDQLANTFLTIVEEPVKTRSNAWWVIILGVGTIVLVLFMSRQKSEMTRKTLKTRLH
jgi:enediyne biosynthesis protein E4